MPLNIPPKILSCAHSVYYSYIFEICGGCVMNNLCLRFVGRLLVACGLATLVLVSLFVLLGGHNLAAAPLDEGSKTDTVTFTLHGLVSPVASVAPFTMTVQAAVTDTDTLVRYHILAEKDGELLEGQVIYYPEAGDPLDAPTQWSTITTDYSGETFFGPEDGFALGSLAGGVTTPFWTRLSTGHYTFTMNLQEITGTIRGTMAHTFRVHPAAQLSFTGLSGHLISGTVPFSITAQVTDTSGISLTQPITTLLRYRAQVMRDGAPLEGQVISYADGTFSTDAEGIAWFGPVSGFRLADLPELVTRGITTAFESNLSPGTYTLTVGLMDITDGQAAARNLGESTVSFDVQGVPAISVQPSNFDISLKSGENATRTLSITNTGNATLYYTLGVTSTVDWLNFPPTGILEADEVDRVTLDFDTRDLDAGIYTTTVWTNSNDPVTPLLGTLVTLTIKPLCLDINTVGSGEVTVVPSQTTYLYGESITLTTTPDPGWEFIRWTGDVTGTITPVAHTVTGDTVVTATFEMQDYELVTRTVGSGEVTVDPSQASYHYGEVVTLTATPTTGWEFIKWTGAVTGTTTPITHTIIGDAMITATFKIYEVYIPCIMHKYAVLTNGNFESGDFRSWEHGGEGFPGYGGTGLPQSIILEEGTYVARLGEPGFSNGSIPVGYGYISQMFTVQSRYLQFQYRIRSHDIFRNDAGDYYDTFEVSMNAPPENIDNEGRDEVCDNSLNPDDSTIRVDGDGLVVCGGRPDVNTDSDLGWRTVTLDLENFMGQSIELYFHTWNRQYSYPAYEDQGWWNTWVDIDDVKWVDTP